MIELAGQPLAQRILRAALARESPPQQLLFHGPRGTGKRAAARIVAWALIDPSAAGNPEAASLDLSIVAASGPLVLRDDLDPALAALAARPVVGRRRVVIIEGAERLKGFGGNRILKPLEEPPAHSHLILVSESPEDLEPTVRSRCLPVPFRSPGWRMVAEGLRAQGAPAEDADGLARAAGAPALVDSPFTRQMRRLGQEMGLAAITGESADASLVARIAADIEQIASAHPSAQLEQLRREAADKQDQRGGKTAAKRALDQEKRERRRAGGDGWQTVLDAAGAVLGDAGMLALGANDSVRYAGLATRIQVPAERIGPAGLAAMLDHVQQARADLGLYPSIELRVAALLHALVEIRAGRPAPHVRAGRLIV